MRVNIRMRLLHTTQAINFLSLALLHQARLTGYITFDKLALIRSRPSCGQRKVETTNKLDSC